MEEWYPHEIVEDRTEAIVRTGSRDCALPPVLSLDY